MFHSFCFDFSVWEIYGALLFGGKLIVVPKNIAQDSMLFSDLLIGEKVTVLSQTPSAFYNLQQVYSDRGITETNIRYVIFGGEALNPLKLHFWKESFQNSQLINMYGITETTVHVTYKNINWNDVKSGNNIIGKPIPTLTFYILNNEKQLSPVGVTGEFYVGGSGLARGYLNRPELTAERFIKNYFGDNSTLRLYKTGDTGRWLPDGNIEYQGRIDDQVKIRGFRIELGEIETVLQQSNLVSQNVIIAKEGTAGTKHLVAYVIPQNTVTFDRHAAQEYLHGKLPEYMVPMLWVELESFPLTTNGKVDRKALPEPSYSDLSTSEYQAPQNETEQQLANIWQELLGVEQIGINDNFFELGGDSILTIQLVSRIRRLGYELQPKDIFINQTIGQLSQRISTASGVRILGEQGTLSGSFGFTADPGMVFGKRPG